MTFHQHCSVRREFGHLAWPLLGLIIASLIGVTSLEIASIAVDDQSDAPVPAHLSLAAVTAPALERVDDSPQRLNGMLARPLFSQNRRPPADTSLLVAGPLESLPRLSGVIVSPVGGFAIFANTEGGKPIVVEEGGHIGSAVIEAIAAGQVTLRGPNGIVVLRPMSEDSTLQVSWLSPVDPARPGYRQPQDGHYGAFWKTVAAAARPGSNQ